MKRLIGYTAALCLLAIMVGCGGVTSTGTLAYISNSTGSGFTVFTVNTDGTLTKSSISPQASPAPPKVLQFAANGKWAYFLDEAGSNIYAYTRAGNGTLATLINSYTVGANASSLVVAPNSTFLYVALPATKKLAIYSIDQSTGILSQVANNQPIGYAVTQLVMSPTGGVLFGLAGVYPPPPATNGVSQQTVLTWTLNSSTGGVTGPLPQPVGISPSYMALSTNGSYLYVLDSTATTNIGNAAVNCQTATNATTSCSPNIYGFSVDSTKGALSTMGAPFNENPDANGNYPTNPVAAATSNDSRYLFVANKGSHNISVFKISSSPTSTTSGAGSLTEVLGSVSIINGNSVSTASPFDCGSGCDTPSFVAVSNANNALYIIDPGGSAGNGNATGKIFQFQIDQSTGKLRAQNPQFVTAEGGPTWITIR
jgi:6-phosphogluconolactonase (cycloisomerase 2 family)